MSISSRMKIKRFSFPKILLVCAVIVAIFFLSIAPRNNNRALIAQALLYEPSVKLAQHEKRIDPVFSGALNGKFPPGTDARKLFSFVSSLGGRCTEYLEGKVLHYTHICTIELEAEFFSSTELMIEVKVGQAKIAEIQASQYYEYY